MVEDRLPQLALLHGKRATPLSAELDGRGLLHDVRLVTVVQHRLEIKPLAGHFSQAAEPADPGEQEPGRRRRQQRPRW